MQEKPKTDRKNSTRKIIRFQDELLALIDQERGSESFSAWVQDACREKLQGNNKVTGK